jgi:hypothetical protein
MTFPSRSLRRWVALAVGGVLPVLSVAVPLLDSGHPNHAVVLEGDHDASARSIPHDHTICLQYASNLSEPSTPAAPLVVAALVAPAWVWSDQGIVPFFPSLPDSRAPPLL